MNEKLRNAITVAAVTGTILISAGDAKGQKTPEVKPTQTPTAQVDEFGDKQVLEAGANNDYLSQLGLELAPTATPTAQFTATPEFLFGQVLDDGRYIQISINSNRSLDVEIRNSSGEITLMRDQTFGMDGEFKATVIPLERQHILNGVLAIISLDSEEDGVKYLVMLNDGQFYHALNYAETFIFAIPAESGVGSSIATSGDESTPTSEAVNAERIVRNLNIFGNEFTTAEFVVRALVNGVDRSVWFVPGNSGGSYYYLNTDFNSTNRVTSIKLIASQDSLSPDLSAVDTHINEDGTVSMYSHYLDQTLVFDPNTGERSFTEGRTEVLNIPQERNGESADTSVQSARQALGYITYMAGLDIQIQGDIHQYEMGYAVDHNLVLFIIRNNSAASKSIAYYNLDLGFNLVANGVTISEEFQSEQSVSMRATDRVHEGFITLFEGRVYGPFSREEMETIRDQGGLLILPPEIE